MRVPVGPVKCSASFILIGTTFSSSRRPPRPESFRPPVQRLGRNRELCCKLRSCLRLPTALVSQRLFGALCGSQFRISFSDTTYAEHYLCHDVSQGKRRVLH